MRADCVLLHKSCNNISICRYQYPGLKIPSPFPAPILLIITFLIYILRKMKIPIITTRDIGNGNMIEIVMLIAKDIPIQISWLRRNCLLSILVFISPQLFQCLIY